MTISVDWFSNLLRYVYNLCDEVLGTPLLTLPNHYTVDGWDCIVSVAICEMILDFCFAVLFPDD